MRAQPPEPDSTRRSHGEGAPAAAVGAGPEAVAAVPALLQVQGLGKRFGGHEAVRGVSFTLERGCIAGLIGPNGAGKTTVFNCLAGALRPSSGLVRLMGRDITGCRSDTAFRAGLARTFQIPRPFPEMTVLDNVMLAPAGQLGERFWANWLRPGAVRAQERQTLQAARHWIDFVGLGALEHQQARVLSGGQRKLLELARVMVSEPQLVLLDEPGAGVNPALLQLIVERIGALNRQGVSFLIIEHNMDLVARLCQPVMVMAQGELLISGTAQAVLSDPRVVEAYLGVEA